MKLNWIVWLCVAMSGALLSGCVTTLDGRQQAGMPFRKDTIEHRYERPALEIWTAAKDVLRFNGTLYSEDMLKSVMEGSVNERTIWIKVEELNKSLSRVTVQTRPPDLELAGELDKQIALRLATGNLTPAARTYPTPATPEEPATE